MFHERQQGYHEVDRELKKRCLTYGCGRISQSDNSVSDWPGHDPVLSIANKGFAIDNGEQRM